jgi:high-affinity iron transporter
MGGGDDINEGLFNVAIATIFAREVLEGAIIILNYRTVIQRNEEWDEETRKKALKNVTYSASIASFVAILVVLALAIPLGVLSKDLNEQTIEIIEGVSKIVASI